MDGDGNVIVTGTSGTIKYSGVGAILWNKPGDGANSVVVDGSNNVFLAGPELRKYLPDGSVAWNNASLAVVLVALDSGGNVYTAKSEDNGYGYDFLTTKYSGEGVRLWTKSYDGPENMDDEVRSLLVDADGNVFVHGQSVRMDEYGDAWFTGLTTVVYSGAGYSLWNSYFKAAVPEGSWARAYAYGANLDADGNLFFVGDTYYYSSGFVEALVVIKYSSAMLPRLRITRTPGNAVEVSWPSPSIGFTLQENTDAGGRTTWSNVSAAVQDDGSRKKVIVDGAGNRFYRLSGP